VYVGVKLPLYTALVGILLMLIVAVVAWLTTIVFCTCTAAT
jgi:hypothetical protein